MCIVVIVVLGIVVQICYNFLTPPMTPMSYNQRLVAIA